jgi:hypothetical protein
MYPPYLSWIEMAIKIVENFNFKELKNLMNFM